MDVSSRKVEILLEGAEPLNADELLDAAQRLIERARNAPFAPAVDVNLLAGTLTLEEDPMAIQERMRRESD